MEQKTINQNKLQTLLCIIALTLGVLVSAVLFSMPPVHASNGFVDSIPESHNSFTYFCSNTFELYNEKKANGIVYPYTNREEKTVFLPNDVFFTFVQKSNYKNTTYTHCPIDAYFVSQKSFQLYYYVDNDRIYKYDSFYSNTTGLYFLNSTFLSEAFGSVGQLDTWEGGIISDASFSNSIFYYDTDDVLNAYLKKIVDEKIDTAISPVVPDLIDEAYTFTGFSINGITARWTGTTERSHLKDQDVEEYTRITYGFATSEDQILNSDNFIEYDQDFAVGEKQMTIPWSEIESNKKDGEFIRQVNFIPCYRVPGAFYLGKGVKVFFKSDGLIDKIEYAQKQTDLNTGNMIFDSSIGYLQNVIYTEEKTHDGKGRQATFKWSTSKSLPDDAQVEIVAQNFYIEWFNKKTEENFIYKEYGEDCIYKNGSFSFNANTPVWTWLSEKEINPFSIKTQSYGTTEYYLRIVTYNEKDCMYHYGGWVRVNVKSKDATNMPTTDVETGGFNDDSGLWNKDYDSDDSYHYSTDGKGDLTGNISVSDWEDLNINSFTWMYRNLQSMVQSLGQLPTMISTIFGFLPNQVITAISVLLIAVVLMRFLGR